MWREETLQREVLVQPNGAISFPLAGRIHGDGLSMQQLEEQLEARLGEYIAEPTVSVSLVESLGNRIYLVGQVRQPGEYIVSRPVDAMQALALAGGLTPFADQDQIKIFRGETPDKQAFSFNYKDVTKGKNLDQNITLLPGDTVVVP